MATEEYGYKGAQCYYWTRYDDGSMQIINGVWNYFRKKYDESWDYKKKKEKYYYYEDRNGDGKYETYSDYRLVYEYDENGNHPTVSGDGAALIGGKFNDAIHNEANSANIKSGAGDDEIYNSGKGTVIDGGEDNDTIENSGASVTIDAGEDNDFISNGGYWHWNAGSYHNGGNKVTIDGGKNDDDIYNEGKYAIIKGGAGNDTINNGSYGYYQEHKDEDFYDEIDGGDNDDHIINWLNKVTLGGGSGDDFINNHGDKATILDGTGKDQISNVGNNIKINTAADTIGDDIFSSGNDVTITAGNGNNTVEIHGENVELNIGGAGNDYIWNESEKAIIESGEDNDKIINSGASVTIDAGEDNDNIENSGAEVSIFAGEDDTTIRNTGKDVTILGGEDNDNIYSEGATVKIDTGGGKDSVTVVAAAGYNDRDIEIFTGEQAKTNDYVFLQDKGGSYYWYSSKITVNTGLGNDTVWNQGLARATINTGVVGNDSVRNSGTNVSIATGFGKDTIENYAENVTINSGTTSDTSKDLIKNYAEYVTIIGGDGNDEIQTSGVGKVSINAGKGADVIRVSNTTGIGDFLTALIKPATKVANEAINQSLGININQTLNDLKILSGEKIVAGDIPTIQERRAAGDRLLQTGRDLALKTKEQDLAVSENGITNSPVYKATTSLADKLNKVNQNLSMMKAASDAAQEYIDSEIIKKVAQEALSGFEQDDSGRWVFATNTYTAAKSIRSGLGNDKIYSDSFCFNVYEYYAGDGNDIIYNWNSNDTLKVMSGTYVGKCVGNDYVVYVGSGSITFKNYGSRRHKQINTGEWLPLYIEGNGTAYQYKRQPDDADYSEPAPPEGVDASNSKITADNNFSGEIDTSDTVYSADIDHIDASKTSNGVKITGGISSYSSVYGSSYSYRIPPTTSWIIGGKGSDKVFSMNQGRVNSGAGNDFVFSYGDKSVITDTDGDDQIINSINDTTIEAGKGNDSIVNGGDNVVFIYRTGDGKDTITGFNETSKLIISGGSYSSLKSDNGKDLIFKVDDGSITLVDAATLSNPKIEGVAEAAKYILNGVADTNLTLTGGTGNDTIDNYANHVTIDTGAGNNYIHNYWTTNHVKVIVGDGDDTVWNQSSYATIDTGNGNDLIEHYGNEATINAGEGDDYIQSVGYRDSISGGSGNDSIHNFREYATINGGKGNDILIGGKGNDSLWGNAGADKFIYSAGDGKDIIFGFDNKDTLTLDGLDFTPSYKNEILTLKVDGGSVTFKEFTATTFHVNDDTYQISGKKFVNK